MCSFSTGFNYMLFYITSMFFGYFKNYDLVKLINKDKQNSELQSFSIIHGDLTCNKFAIKISLIEIINKRMKSKEQNDDHKREERAL